jgi:energy-coupling factor transport system ATP-binding protein
LALIKFEDVTFVHQTGVKALDKVTLSIDGGEIIGIVGENGAGKTTLVRHINGLLKPLSGQVTVDGQRTTEVSTAKLARKVGIAFQNPDHQLFSDSVEKEVAFALVNFGFEPSVIEERVNWALDFFGLERYRKSSPLILSGGEKKRLTLASILAWDPSIVILDEPTVGQDANQKEKLTEVTRHLHSDGKTLIIVSHDVEYLWSLQPRIVVMRQGKVVGDGSCTEVMQDREMLARARVRQPQLVRLYEGLGTRPDRPFLDVSEARTWIIKGAG